MKPSCPDDYTEAVAMAAGCWPAPEVPATVNTAELGDLGLSPAEEAALVAFLKALSDGYPPDKIKSCTAAAVRALGPAPPSLSRSPCRGHHSFRRT